MGTISYDDVLRYAQGDVTDASEEDRIAAAIRDDPQVAAWHSEIQTSLEPSAETAGILANVFRQIERSRWVSLQFDQGSPSAGQSCEATIGLSTGRPQPIRVHNTGGAIRLEFARKPTRWRPASLGLFTPKRVQTGKVELAGRTPQEARPGRGDPAFFGALSAKSANQAWRVGPIRSKEGLEVWIEDSVAGAMLFCKASENVAHTGHAKYRLRWTDADGVDHEQSASFPLSESSGHGEAPLRLPAAKLQRMRSWSVSVWPCGLSELPQLDAEQFRECTGEDFETLILVPAAASPGALEAMFHNDDQCRLWSDPEACRMIRFEPV